MERLVKCSACAVSVVAEEKDRLFDSADNLWMHIANVHLSWYPFECVLCPMLRMPGDLVLKQHYEKTHPGRAPKAIYTYEEEKKQEVWRIFLSSQTLTECNSEAQGEVKLELISNNNAPEPGMIDLTRKRQLSDAHYAAEEPTSDKMSDNDEMKSTFPLPNVSTRSKTQNASKERHISLSHITPSSTPLIKLDLSTESMDLSNSDEEETCTEINNVDVANERNEKNKRRRNRPLIECKRCGKFVKQDLTSSHVWTHMRYRRFKCDACNFLTNTASAVRQHCVQKHEGNATYTDRRQTDLKEMYIAAFEATFRSYTRGGSQTPVIPSSKTHICRLCGRVLGPNYANRTKHVWQHHTKRKRFTCNLCSEERIGMDRMKIHARSKHGVSDGTTCWTDNKDSSEFMTAYHAAFEVKGKEQNIPADTSIKNTDTRHVIVADQILNDLFDHKQSFEANRRMEAVLLKNNHF